jgi:hypothetical protein
MRVYVFMMCVCVVDKRRAARSNSCSLAWWWWCMVMMNERWCLASRENPWPGYSTFAVWWASTYSSDSLGYNWGQYWRKRRKSSPDPRRTQSITETKQQQRSHMLVHGSLSLSDIDLLPLCHGGQLVSAQMDKWIIVYYLYKTAHTAFIILILISCV